MSEFIAQLFTDFTTADSLIVLAFLLGAFLIGLISGRASLSGKLKKMRKEKEQQAGILAAAKVKEKELLLLTTAQGNDLQTQAEALEKAKTQLAQQRQQSSKYEADWQSGQAQIKQLEADALEYQNQLKELAAATDQSGEVQGALREQVLQLEGEVTKQQATIATLEQAQNDWQLALDQQAADPQNTVLENTRLQLIEDKIALLQKENQHLQSAIEELQEGDESVGVVFDENEIIEVQEGNMEEPLTASEESTDVYDFISPREKANMAKAALNKYFGNKVALATPHQKDQLQNINGIGPFIEEQLNGIGIYTFEQISQFDEEIMVLVTDAIQFFPGRIKRDDWQGQAKGRLKN